jgi:hypothetical protein
MVGNAVFDVEAEMAGVLNFLSQFCRLKKFMPRRYNSFSAILSPGPKRAPHHDIDFFFGWKGTGNVKVFKNGIVFNSTAESQDRPPFIFASAASSGNPLQLSLLFGLRIKAILGLS